jgi:aryl carrier-like protein
MVPQAFVALETMPLASSGKLDRKALPAPDGKPLSCVAFSPPQSLVEQRIARAWREVLHVERVGRRDNFFDLGGHSLLMLKVYEQLRRHHPRIALVDLFHYPTVDALSRFLSSDDDISPTMAGRGRRRREALKRRREHRTESAARH